MVDKGTGFGTGLGTGLGTCRGNGLDTGFGFGTGLSKGTGNEGLRLVAFWREKLPAIRN